MPSLPVMTYNGIDMMLGKIITFRQKAVYDDTGTRYLYTHFLVAVQCVVNPLGTQVGVLAIPDPVDPRGPRIGAMPGRAIAELRTRLLTPRAKLRMLMGNDILLESPQRTAVGGELPTDANNGPNPISFDIDTVLGMQTVLATFTIETWLNECVSSAGNPLSALLAHNWEMEEDIDEDYFSTRTISGRATFRTDFLNFWRVAAGAVLAPGAPIPADADWVRPDDFRSGIFHPVPLTYQRTRVNVRATGDGTSIVYRITDEMRNWGIRPEAGIIRCKGRLKRGYDWTGPTNPSSFWDYYVEVTGYPDSNSFELVSALITIWATSTTQTGRQLMVALGPPAGALVPARLGVDRSMWHSAEIEVEFPRRHASLHIRQQLGPVQAFMVGGLSQFDFWPESAGENFGPHVEVNAGMIMRNSSGTDPLLMLIAQELSAQCSRPATPETPREPLNLNP